MTDNSGSCRPFRRPRVVVSGFVGLFPFGGVIWDYVQYVAGLAKLGDEQLEWLEKDVAGRILHEKVEIVRVIVGPIHGDHEFGLRVDFAVLSVRRDREQCDEKQEGDDLERLK